MVARRDTRTADLAVRVVGRDERGRYCATTATFSVASTSVCRRTPISW